MSVQENLRLLILSGLVLLLAGTAKAAVDGDGRLAGAVDDTGISDTSNSVGNPIACVDLNADCSTLLVNYHSDSVKFALFQRGNLKDPASGAEIAGNDSAVDKAHPLKNLSTSKEVTPDSNEILLGIDFLRGLQGSGDDPAFQGEPSGEESGPLEEGEIQDWAFAAVASMDYNFQQSNPDGIAVPKHWGKGSTTFWDFMYVYQWEVEVNALDIETTDISQLTLSNIYLSPKVHATSNSDSVVCGLIDPDNC